MKVYRKREEDRVHPEEERMKKSGIGFFKGGGGFHSGRCTVERRLLHRHQLIAMVTLALSKYLSFRGIYFFMEWRGGTEVKE